MQHRVFRALSAILKNVLSVVVRAVVTTLVFGACVVGTAHYMGVPLPSPAELLQKFEGVSKLGKVLS